MINSKKPFTGLSFSFVVLPLTKIFSPGLNSLCFVSNFMFILLEILNLSEKIELFFVLSKYAFILQLPLSSPIIFCLKINED